MPEFTFRSAQQFSATTMDHRKMKRLSMDMDGIRIDSVHSSEASDTTSDHDNDNDNDNDSLSTSNLFELRLTSTKGFGLVATKDIPRGTCVTSELPLFALPPTVSHNGPERALAILRALQRLTASQLDAYTALHYNARSVNSPMREAIRTHLLSKQYTESTLETAVKDNIIKVAIFNTNCVSMGENSSLGSGIFLNFSRANHSCTPNVENCFNTVTGCETLYAIREIEENAEITVSYIDQLYLPIEERQHALRRWEFKCDCAACEGPEAEESAHRRRKIEGLTEVFARLEKKPRPASSSPLRVRMPKSVSEKSEFAEDLVTLLKEEGLVGMPLAYALRWASKYGLEAGKCLAALEFARQAVEVEQTCAGNVMKLPDSAEAWLNKLESMAASDDKRFKAERERARKEQEKERIKNEKEEAKREKDEAKLLEKEAWQKKKAEEVSQMALWVAEAARLKREREISESEAKVDAKKKKEAAKTALKKARRVVRTGAEKTEIADLDIERLLAALGAEETVALAEKLSELQGESEVWKILHEEMEKKRY
ncbi:hypothetical protein LTR97_007913 [Elasticomyces elasticus]|uniref:SET domain-containing protein n=1 Tax=Elasticomyces elasticus TaxID=574655 RepID=A0AAN7VQH5_9PEZI|nr:hypothetical protein LTR97_007913 [Elasticomyces elasticus]